MRLIERRVFRAGLPSLRLGDCPGRYAADLHRKI